MGEAELEAEADPSPLELGTEAEAESLASESCPSAALLFFGASLTAFHLDEWLTIMQSGLWPERPKPARVKLP